MTTAHQPGTDPTTSTTTDPLSLIDVDHIRFYVSNAKQAAHFYAQTFGFQVDQVADLTTGCRDEASYLLTQGNIRLILTSPLDQSHPAADEIKLYGDGIKDVAFTVFDAEKAFEVAVKNGGEVAYEPTTDSDETGSVTRAGIKTYGRVIHSFVSRTGAYDLPNVKKGGLIASNFRKIENYALNDYNKAHPCGLMFTDHLVGNVEKGKMNHWVKWYEDVLEFKMFMHFDDADISTEYSALMSKVMASGNNLIKMPINEPADGKRKSQIQEYLDWHNGSPGIQHLAFRNNDQLESVAELRRRGVDFLHIPDDYYDEVWDRVAKMGWEVKEDHQRVKDLGILIDADEEGYLLQLFTKPLQDRPTLFFEIICRRGSQSFGKGNFKALFEALEIEQDRRGNL